jgi:hypothetical protein
MALRLRPFPAGSADVVSRGAKTAEEVLMWCGHPDAPVPAEQISTWANEDGVETVRVVPRSAACRLRRAMDR